MEHNDDIIFSCRMHGFYCFFLTSTHKNKSEFNENNNNKNSHQVLSNQTQHKDLFSSPKLQHRDVQDLHPALDLMFVAICKTISFNKKEKDILNVDILIHNRCIINYLNSHTKNEHENKQVNIFLPAEAIQSRLRDMGHI